MMISSFPIVNDVRFPYERTTQRDKIYFTFFDNLFHQFKSPQATHHDNGYIHLALYPSAPIPKITLTI
jgi:hypothetical protein